METMYFISGISLVVVVAIAIATIWSVLRIIKNQKTTEHLQRDVIDIASDIQRQQDVMHRDIDDTIQHQAASVDQRIDSLYRTIDDAKRYTDSRIDKMMNDPKFCLNTQAKNNSIIN